MKSPAPLDPFAVLAALLEGAVVALEEWERFQNRMLAILCAIVLALLCLALTACGPSSGSSSRAMSGVAFVGTFSPLERARTEQALALHRSRFEDRYGPQGGIAVEAHPGALLPSGNVAEAIVGDRPGYRIAVGPDQDCAGATHELHHLAHDPSTTHADPRWPGWDLEDQATVASIGASR